TGLNSSSGSARAGAQPRCQIATLRWGKAATARQTASRITTKTMPPGFTKFHGFGNDYIVIESDKLTGANIPASEFGAFAKRICNRHYGAGGDGIAVVAPAEVAGADYHVRIFNPDGSEASLSGNGTRCAAAYLYYKNIWAEPELRLSTRAGIKLYTLREQTGVGRYIFDSELGQPGLASA